MSDVIKARITVSLTIILVILGNLFLWPWMAQSADQWHSPSSYEASDWISEQNSYDENTGICASYDVGGHSWSPYITLYTDGEISSSKVRVWSEREYYINELQVDVYYSDDWENIHDGSLTLGQFVEYSIGSTQDISGVRIRYYNPSSYDKFAYCCEVDVWGSEVEDDPDSIDLVPSSDTNYVGTNHTFNATVTLDSSPLPDIAVTWNLTGVGEILISDSTTDESGIAQATITSNTSGNSTMECYVTANSSITDTAIKTWEDYPITDLVVSPSSDTNYVATNHTFNATVTNANNATVSDAGVTWNFTGPGEILCSDNTTDQDGVSQCTVSSNTSGTQVVCCYLTANTSIYDCGNKTWEDYPITDLVVSPSSDTNYVATNHTFNATVTNANNATVSDAGVTWNFTGPGEILCSDNTTDQDGVSQCTVSSNTSGTQVVCCYLTANTTIYDCGNKTWEDIPLVPTTLVLKPSNGQACVTYNQTFIATVYDQYENEYDGCNVTWNLTGAGDILTSDSTTNDNGNAYAKTTSDTPGEMYLDCYVTSNSSVTDSSIFMWTAITPSSININPAWFNRTLGQNVTVTALVQGCGDTLSGISLSWNISGVGEILTSDNTTDENGEADCTVVSTEPGDCDIYCTINATELQDYSNGIYATDVLPSDTFLPWWFWVLLAVSLASAWYTKSFILGGLSIGAIATGIVWIGDTPWSPTIIIFVRAIFIALIGFVIFWMIREGSLFGDENSEESYED